MRVTNWDTETHPTQNFNSYINRNSQELVVGSYIGGTSNANNDNHIEGYLAETVFIDGSQLAVTEFGRTNEDGVWVNKTYDGSYSGNSFRLVYDNSAGLGDDSSGLGNDFTANNFETTALSSSNFSNDIDYTDTPTNNVPVINPHIKTPTSTVLSEGLLKNIDSNGNYPNVIPGTSVCRGKQYWEYEYLNPSGYPYLGLAKALDIQNGSTWYNTGGGIFYVTSSGSVGGWTDNTATGWSASAGDILSCAYDADTQQMQFRLNNGNAVTKTVSGYTGDVVPMISDALSKGARVNFGNYPFRYTPPAGYTGMASNDLDEPAIKDPKKHFDIITWTGNGTDDRDITGLDFAPDFVWFKQTDTTNNHLMYDTCRGATIRQISSSNVADSTLANDLQAFNSDGFQVGDGGRVNNSGSAYKAHCWKAGGAPTATNSAGAGNVPTAGSVKIDDANLTTALSGTIAANKLSANTTAGFSIVTYTGTGANATVAHGLTQAPDLVFYKITSSTNGWCVYSRLTGPTKYMQLNQAGAETTSSTVFNDTDPTSSVLNVGTNVLTNGNTSSYLAYCWHSVPGFSKIGEHRGNGNADGNFIHLDFRPRFLIVKGTNSNNWVWYDSEGHKYNPVDRYQYANLTNAEDSSSTVEVDFYANGFKFRDSHSMINASGVYYLYMAFAENPFGGENTAPATAF